MTSYSNTAIETVTAATTEIASIGRDALAFAYTEAQLGAGRRKPKALPADDAVALQTVIDFVLAAYYTPRLFNPDGSAVDMPVEVQLAMAQRTTDDRTWTLFPSGRMAVTDKATGLRRLYNAPSRAMWLECDTNGARSYECFTYLTAAGHHQAIDQLRPVAGKRGQQFNGYLPPVSANLEAPTTTA